MTPWVLIDYAGLTLDGLWTQEEDERMMLGTLLRCSSSHPPSTLPSLYIPIFGTHLEMYGNIPSGTQMQYTHPLGEKSLFTSIGNESVMSSLVWSVDIPQGDVGTNLELDPPLNLFLEVDAGAPVIDYLLTPWQGKLGRATTSIIVDDRDEMIQFRGSWIEEVGPNTTSTSAFRNTRMGSRTVGDQMTFTFFGSSIKAYGITNSGSGRLAFNVSLDNAPPVTHVQCNGTQPNKPDNWFINVPFYNLTWDPENVQRHVLNITVHEATESQMLWLDYLVFESNDRAPVTSFRNPNPTASPNVAASNGSGKQGTPPMVVPIVVMSLLFLLGAGWWLTTCRRGRPLASNVVLPDSARTPRPTRPEPSASNSPGESFQQVLQVDDTTVPPPYTQESASNEITLRLVDVRTAPAASSIPTSGVLQDPQLSRIQTTPLTNPVPIISRTSSAAEPPPSYSRVVDNLNFDPQRGIT